MLDEALKYSDTEKVYDMIKRKGFIVPKIGSLSPYWFFFNGACYELEKQGRIVRESKGWFFWSKKSEVPYGAWRLPNKNEMAEFKRKIRKEKLRKLNNES